MKLLNIFLLFTCLIFFACKGNFVEPENQFVQLYFKYGFKNELNTFENTFQKDLIMDGVIKVSFWLTDEEQNSILEQANLIDYFSMPDTFKYVPQDSITYSISPDPGEQVLRIKYKMNDKTTIYTYPFPIITQDDTRFNNLKELRQHIVRIIESKLLYKLLPEPRGAYL